MTKKQQTDIPGRTALRQAYKQAAQVYDQKPTRFERIKRRILAQDLFKVIAADERCTISYVSMVRMRAGLPRRVNPRLS